MSAKTPKRAPAQTMRDRENLLVAALIDPNTRATAAAVIEKNAVVPEMFTNDTARDNFNAVTIYGTDSFRGYLEQRPVADFTKGANAATLEAAAAEIVAAYNREHPKQPTDEEMLLQAGIVVEDAVDFLKREIPQPRWIVQDFIAQNMKGDLCGGAKSMKTFAALQMAVSIAAGRDFLNVYHVENPHTVAYLNLELTDWNAQERLGDMKDALDITDEELLGRLYILNMRANPAVLRGQSDLDICGKCPNKVTCHGKIEKLCKAARAESIRGHFANVLKKKGVEFVIIDPRYKLNMPGEDENTAEGLRGILELRDDLARHFAVAIVTHDKKGDTSELKTTDRGAGSYTAGADFDFRLTIDRSKDYNEDKGDILYVVGAACRARKTPPKVGVRFTGQIFKAEDGLTTELKTTRRRGELTEGEKVEKNRKEIDDFRAAVLALASEHGHGDPIATEVFKTELKGRPGGAVGEKKRDEYFRALIANRVIVQQPELRRDEKTGAVVQKARKNGGRVFVMTPDVAEAYRAKFDGLAL